MRQQWRALLTMRFFTARLRSRLLGALVFAVLQGCEPSEPDALLQGYATALGTSLGVAPPTTAIFAISPPPRPEALQLAIPGTGLEDLDVLRLSGCAVQATIIKRDSNLGRSAKASQHLLLALEYLQLAPECIRQLTERGNAALAINLETAWREYRAQLPALIFNATLGSDEYRALWLPDRAPLDYPPSEPGAAAVALGAIDSEARRWLSGDYRAQNRKLELLLSEIAGGEGGARWQALSRQSDWLASADDLLSQFDRNADQCAAPASTATILHPLARLHAYLTDGIQPRYTRDLHRYRIFLGHITELEQQLAAVLPLSYRDWQQHRNQRFATIATAARRHREHFELLLQRCSPEHLALSPNDGKIGYTATPTQAGASAEE